MSKMIKRPIFSEKSLQDATDGKFTFEVDLKANKKEIASEIHKAFKVDVTSVRTRILKGRRRRIRGTSSEREDSKIKKATVVVKSGQKIKAFETG